MFWQIIQLAIASMLTFYVLALICDFFYELKMNELYKKKQSALRNMEGSRLSMAVVHAKTFKIEMDYAAIAAAIEKKRSFIRNMVLHRDRSFLSK